MSEGSRDLPSRQNGKYRPITSHAKNSASGHVGGVNTPGDQSQPAGPFLSIEKRLLAGKVISSTGEVRTGVEKARQEEVEAALQDKNLTDSALPDSPSSNDNVESPNEEYEPVSQGGKPHLSIPIETDFDAMEAAAAAKVQSQREDEARIELNKEALEEELFAVGAKHTRRFMYEVASQQIEGTLINTGFIRRKSSASFVVHQKKTGITLGAKLQLDRKKKESEYGGISPSSVTMDASLGSNGRHPVLSSKIEFNKGLPTRCSITVNDPDKVRGMLPDSQLGRLLGFNFKNEEGRRIYPFSFIIDSRNQRVEIKAFNRVYQVEYDPRNDTLPLRYMNARWSYSGKEFAQLYDQMLSLVPDNPNPIRGISSRTTSSVVPD